METHTPSCLRPVMHPSKEVSYGIGEQHQPNSFGMWAGLVTSEFQVLEMVGKSDKSCIIQFNLDGTDEVVWQWDDNRNYWVRPKELSK